MPYVSSATDPFGAQQTLNRVTKELDRDQNVASLPVMQDPSEKYIFLLDAGVQRLDGGYDREFEVRELTGRDEEALGRIKEGSRFIPALLKAGLVRIGNEKVSDDLLDIMIGGDWNQVLLMIRVVTFGSDYDYSAKCRACSHKWSDTFDLINLQHHSLPDPAEITFHATGRKGTDYTLTQPLGSTNRLLMSKPDATPAEIRTVMLRECVMEIDGKDVSGTNRALDLTWADRRIIMDAISERQVGPDLAGVMIKCPECDVEQPMPLTIAALFL